MEDKDKIVLKLSKKDKIYISIIFVLVCACFVLAIVLPRPYRIEYIDKPVYETVYQKVYETESVYLISPSSTLYDGSINGYNDGSVQYNLTFNKNYIDTGNLKEIKVSVKTTKAGTEEQKSIVLDSNITALIVANANLNSFGVDIEINNTIMNNINTAFIQMLGENKSNPLDYYLFEISFEKCVINYVVAYISE